MKRVTTLIHNVTKKAVAINADKVTFVIEYKEDVTLIAFGIDEKETIPVVGAFRDVVSNLARGADF